MCLAFLLSAWTRLKLGLGIGGTIVKLRSLVAAIALATTTLATTSIAPAYAGWDEIKDAASKLGEEVGKGSKEAWDSVSDFSKETWDSVSEWGEDAYNTAGEWTDASIEKSKEWLDVADAKLDEMLEPETPEEARLALEHHGRYRTGAFIQ